MIDAEFRSEERFSRLSLAFCSKEEREKVVSQVEEIIKKHSLTPDIHFSDVANGKAVMVIEYHDDINREAGEIFEEIISKLNITSCD